MTCLWSHSFIAADPSRGPVYPSSWASCLRALRLLSRFNSFIKSTIDCFQLQSARCAPGILAMIASTSVGDSAFGVLAAGADAAVARAPGGGLAAAGNDPKMADAMLPKMLILFLL